MTYTIKSCEKVSNRYYIVDENGKIVHSESNYDQAEYICKLKNETQ